MALLTILGTDRRRMVKLNTAAAPKKSGTAYSTIVPLQATGGFLSVTLARKSVSP